MTMSTNQVNVQEITLSAFNCNGMNGSMAFITELTQKHDITFVCEHWLRPDELVSIQKCFHDKLCFLKSSMSADEKLIGRPFGGVGFVCNKLSGISYRPVEIESDRISILGVIRNRSVILTAIIVYLPYDDGTRFQTDLYIEVLDKVKSVLDSVSQSGPAIVLGDFNTSLPQKPTLSTNWHKVRPFSSRSAILYDMICEHEMGCSQFYT